MFLSLTLLILGLAGCGSAQKPNAPEVLNTPSADNAEHSGGDASPTREPKTNDENAEGEVSSVLVVYFSGTGNTKAAAELIAEELDADLYEIVPEQAYTADDLNYNRTDSRAQLEQNDEQARPSIKGNLNSLDSYSTIFIGYPLWWGQAPRILSTFLESYNFQDKALIPFCTSASSPLGTSAENLRPLAENAQWFEGRRFSSTADLAEITEWLDTLNLEKQS